MKNDNLLLDVQDLRTVFHIAEGTVYAVNGVSFHLNHGEAIGVVGESGCGKTTTLYIVLESLNKEGTNIVTLEDPIEYYIEGVNQSQIKPEIGYTFANGLRNILRQDPNVIMVGEIRDGETADLAIHAALTGHIVISTLHTNNAVGVIPRLIDLGVKPFLIPATLRVALAQRLVRRSCQACKTRVVPDAKTKETILKDTWNYVMELII